MPMSPKTILVTGCSGGGIGAAIALELTKRGHYVFATARTVSKIPAKLSEASNVTVLPLDVTSPPSIAEAVQAVTASGRPLDVLFNNAGAGYTMPMLDVDVDKAKQVYEVNVWGVVRTVQAFAGLLIKTKGRVVNLSTCGAAVNTPWIAAYCSSKAALTCISETLRLELSPFGVSVATVMAGVVASHFHDNEPGFKLPEGSRYAFIEDIIAGWASGKSKPGGCSAEKFAELLVEDIVGNGKDGLSWKGPHAGGIRFLSTWLPSWCQDAAMSINQGLKELSQNIAGKEKS
ncbi:putative short-chain dehydrogenase reductase family protein [Eutypa lata UCREL1]|uniref:Putative short-chain dehydrogenase reductase family protein n=1 Tax=Eutypa lata (strain UCR-EL1) TaxID=1287681 RepID=M7S944_EUTLA|nr:putative short-chain dehydrogenase reductase family protein [Eutypa lata UCREL1]